MIAYPSYSGLRQRGFLSLPEGFQFPPVHRQTKRNNTETTAPLCKPKRKTRSDKGKKRGPRK